MLHITIKEETVRNRTNVYGIERLKMIKYKGLGIVIFNQKIQFNCKIRCH